MREREREQCNTDDEHAKRKNNIKESKFNFFSKTTSFAKMKHHVLTSELSTYISYSIVPFLSIINCSETQMFCQEVTYSSPEVQEFMHQGGQKH